MNKFEDDVAINESMLRNRLRRMLNREHLDAVHVDLINILTNPDMSDYTIALIEAKKDLEAFKHQHLG